MEEKAKNIVKKKLAKLKLVHKEENSDFYQAVELLMANNFRVLNHEPDRFNLFEAFSYYVYHSPAEADKLRVICLNALKRFEEEDEFPLELSFIKEHKAILEIYWTQPNHPMFEGVSLKAQLQPTGASQ